METWVGGWEGTCQRGLGQWGRGELYENTTINLINLCANINLVKVIIKCSNACFFSFLLINDL